MMPVALPARARAIVAAIVGESPNGNHLVLEVSVEARATPPCGREYLSYPAGTMNLRGERHLKR